MKVYRKCMAKGRKSVMCMFIHVEKGGNYNLGRARVTGSGKKQPFSGYSSCVCSKAKLTLFSLLFQMEGRVPAVVAVAAVGTEPWSATGEGSWGKWSSTSRQCTGTTRGGRLAPTSRQGNSQQALLSVCACFISTTEQGQGSGRGDWEY